MSSSSSLTAAQQGFDAWRRGDFDALEAIFAPEVEWRDRLAALKELLELGARALLAIWSGRHSPS